jgi:signal transduction histidine kinase
LRRRFIRLFPEAPVRWSIRNQILVPFAVLQIVAVAALTLMATLFSVRRVERETDRRLQSVVATLQDSSFPLTGNVLEQMRGLSGAEFAVVGKPDRSGRDRITLATLSGLVSEAPAIPQRVVDDRELQRVSFHEGVPLQTGGRRYLATRVSGLRAGGATDLLILFPEDQWREARRDAILLPLAIGGVTGCGMIAVSVWLASRFGRRMRTIEQQFARIAEGDFEPIALGRRNDELRDLTRSANQMAAALLRMTTSIRQQERQTLVSQLAGGLAHQFRNAMTGARMAIQLHRRRCPAGHEESLDVALRQLALTEQQIKGLLRLASDTQRSDDTTAEASGELAEIIDEVAFLVSPMCEHEEIPLEITAEVPSLRVTDRDATCAAILNLVLNAIEAAGPRGSVAIACRRQPGCVIIDVSDSGPGVSEAVAETLFDPFVTSKPEGVGLGLLLALEAARQHGGTLTCRRESERTVFSMVLPERQNNASTAEHSASTPNAVKEFS